MVCYTKITVFQVGLLYDNDSLQNVLDMIADWTLEEREMLRNKVTSSLFNVLRNGYPRGLDRMSLLIENYWFIYYEYFKRFLHVPEVM